MRATIYDKAENGDKIVIGTCILFFSWIHLAKPFFYFINGLISFETLMR